jgi:hypothetical protein
MNPYQVERLKPWFPGQLGVQGSDNSLGIRKTPVGIVLYVDDSHPRANTTNDGTDPEDPKSTIQSAISSTLLVENSLIIVGGAATLVESAIIPATAPEQCTIMGFGNPEWGPTWTSAAAAEDALTIRQSGWTIANIRFNPNTAGAGIRLDHDAVTTTSDRTRIINCDFDGMWSGLYGVEAVGCPDQVFIEGCRFHEFDSGGAANNAAAIFFGLTPHAVAYLWVIRNNIFQDNDRHIAQVDALRGGNGCLIEGNRFMGPVNQANGTAVYIDMRGGGLGLNTVTGNYFAGDYSNAGGYWANAANPGTWMGNFADDIAEAEVGDNALTIAPPAA